MVKTIFNSSTPKLGQDAFDITGSPLPELEKPDPVLLVGLVLPQNRHECGVPEAQDWKDTGETEYGLIQVETRAPKAIGSWMYLQNARDPVYLEK
ncbi:hypothetical protein STEG23_008822 [Scotinomys teguina]